MKEGYITVAELGPRLKLIRQELGITQKDLAQALNLNQAILSKFENGGMVYASVLLDVLCFFRGKLDLNFLLQPGDKYDFTDERALCSDRKQHDVIIRGKCKMARQDMMTAIDDAKAKLQKALDDLENFCLSE